MKLLIFANRFTSNMDTLVNPEYRTHKIADAMREIGIETKVCLIDYKTGSSESSDYLYSISVAPARFFPSRKLVRKLMADFQPTHVWLTNGPLVAGLAMLLCPSLTRSKLIYEVLDNYDAYFNDPLRFFRQIDRFVRRRAFATLYVSQELMACDQHSKGKKLIFFNGFDPDVFRPLDRQECRRKLSLPEGSRIVGFSGSLDDRVIDNLIAIAGELKGSGVLVAIASNNHLPPALAARGNVKSLGALPMQQVPLVINACDLMIIPNRHDSFTAYCFPSKLTEYMGCESEFLTTPMNTLNSVVRDENISSFNMKQFASDVVARLTASFTPYNTEEFTWTALVKSVSSDVIADI